MDVLGWLRNLGLGQYEAVFRENHIDGSVLSSLTNEDLKDIGVASVGHRRRLLDAIAVLRGGDFGAVAVPVLGTAAEAERRQLTVMFCDLVGSTPLSAGSIPRICAGSSAPTIAASRTLSRALAGLSPATWATAP